MADLKVLQPDLFEDLRDKGIQIDVVAQKAGVSTATIRNWIKTGYLIKDTNGLVDELSFNNFINNVIGKEKLSSRANKSQKDTHDHELLAQNIWKKLSWFSGKVKK